MWKDIESAPKDGTEILVYGGELCSSHGSGSCWKTDGVEKAHWEDGEWWCGNEVEYDEYYYAKPTHWQPLPEPPHE